MRLLHYEGTFLKKRQTEYMYIYIRSICIYLYYIRLENRCKNEKAPKGNGLTCKHNRYYRNFALAFQNEKRIVQITRKKIATTTTRRTAHVITYRRKTHSFAQTKLDLRLISISGRQSIISYYNHNTRQQERERASSSSFDLKLTRDGLSFFLCLLEMNSRDYLFANVQIRAIYTF